MVFFPPIRTFLLWVILLLVTLFSGFFVLTNGLYVDQISLANVTAEDVTLKWENGLNLEINHLQVDTSREDSGKISGIQIQRALKAFQLLRKFIPTITVRSLDYNDFKIEILSRKQESPHPVALTLNSEDLHLEASLTQEQDNIRIDLQNFSSINFNSSATGTFLFDTKTLQVHGELTANLADCLPVQLSIIADLDSISFQGHGTAETTTIKPLVDLFGLDDDIQPWIIEYLTGSSYHLQKIGGTIPLRDPAALLDTLFVSVRVDDCTYTFAQGLEPIKADYAEVILSRGVLDIRPHDATFYGQDGGKSQLDIDFNDPKNILLTAYIRTNVQANRDIFNLLTYYNIRLPFLQTAGTTDTDLTLTINLNNEQVQAFGTFEVGKSMFTYEGISYQVTGGRIDLKGTGIILDGLEIGWDNFFKARISGKIKPRESLMDLTVEVKEVQVALKDTVLALDQAVNPLQLGYHTRLGNSSITVAPSRWLLGNTVVRLDSFSAPFDFKQFSGKLPLTRLVIPSMAELSIAGDFNLKKQQADLQVKLHHLQIQALGLDQESLALAVHYDKQLNITAGETSSWLLAGTDIVLSPFNISYSKDEIRFDNVQIFSVDFFDTLVKGSYNLREKQGQFHLKELLFSQKDRTPFLKFPDELRLTVEIDTGITKINLDELGLSLRSEKLGKLDVDISDIGKLLDLSPLLRRLKISAGKFHLTSTTPSSPLQFTGEVSSSYDFLVQEEIPQSDYVFSGSYEKTGLSLVVNNDFHVRYDGTVTIHSKNIGYNVPALLRFNKDRPKEKNLSKKTDTPDIVLQARDSFLFFSKGRQILADTMTLTASGDNLDLNITHGPGELVIKVIGNSFSLQGHKLNDEFMNAMVVDAHVENGYLDAVAEGTFDRFTAAFNTGRILLKDYATLNNILAVINTLPALITFSLPNYDRDGWPVESMRMWFDYDHGIATIKTLELNSREMDMRGTGTVDLVNQQVQLDINMITRAGQNMSKIPVIGYILAGDEKLPTLTFHVTGDLLNPDVESTVFEEIITSPFDMVLRTLVTPFKWAQELFHQNQTDESKPADDVNKIEHENVSSPQSNFNESR